MIKARYGLTAAFEYLVGEKDEFCQCCLQTSRLRARVAAVCFRGETHVLRQMRLGHTWSKLSARRASKTLTSWTRMILFVRVPLQPRSESSSSR